ncbi:MAG: helix-turn-helix transcriptional regulator [Clostridia bacterium]|nr:helix-turn-helix transcriptional regulator [Clostridia bacterium]
MAVHLFSPGFRALPFYFVTLDVHYTQERVLRQRGFYDLAQLFFVEAGKGYLRVGNESYALEKGSAFFLDRGVPHEYGYTDGLVASWVTFRGSGLEEFRQYIGGRSFLFLQKRNVSRYVSALEGMLEEYRGRKREGILSAMLYSLAVDFFEEETERVEDPMARVLAYIEEHYAQRITLDDLARLSCSSRSSFCKTFRGAFGCTAVEKITEVRLTAARQRLLSFPEEKISTVAAKCGFEDAGYFCKVYKKRYGIPPHQTQK